MDAATLALTPAASQPLARPHLDGGRVRDIVLVRIATAGKALSRADLSEDLWSVVSHIVVRAEWPAALDRDLGALADAGLCEITALTVAITAAGAKRAALVLGVNALPRSWAEAKAVRLVAKALGAEALPARRLKALMKAEGLRSAIVQHAFALKIRGVPTAARLRAQLATLAVSRAFGNTLPAGTDVRSGMSATAGRGLAGRLAHPPREFPTDSRLIAALAMEHAGARKPDFESLQTALLRRYVTRGPVAVVPAAHKVALPAKTQRVAVKTVAVAAPALPLQVRLVPVSVVAASVRAAVRPDFVSFVGSVRTAAHGLAEGWPGNRKAFVSRVWAAVQMQHPEWAVTAIEFKAMLAEAHRLGQIVLANADLKDQRAIADIQASAIAYRNSIFHYVRVDD